MSWVYLVAYHFVGHGSMISSVVVLVCGDGVRGSEGAGRWSGGCRDCGGGPGHDNWGKCASGEEARGPGHWCYCLRGGSSSCAGTLAPFNV